MLHIRNALIERQRPDKHRTPYRKTVPIYLTYEATAAIGTAVIRESGDGDTYCDMFIIEDEEEIMGLMGRKNCYAVPKLAQNESTSFYEIASVVLTHVADVGYPVTEGLTQSAKVVDKLNGEYMVFCTKCFWKGNRKYVLEPDTECPSCHRHNTVHNYWEISNDTPVSVVKDSPFAANVVPVTRMNVRIVQGTKLYYYEILPYATPTVDCMVLLPDLSTGQVKDIQVTDTGLQAVVRLVTVLSTKEVAKIAGTMEDLGMTFNELEYTLPLSDLKVLENDR